MLIPVIDLMNGVAVHARQGQRELYLPVNSPLCPSANVHDVISAFLQVSDFKIIYLADLNAITGQGNNNNQQLINTLLADYPEILFWIDSGFQAAPCQYNNYKQVLGSEYYHEETLATLESFEKNFILSLDFSHRDEKLGCQRLFDEPDLLPSQIIIMTLVRVGSNAGPDFQKLRYYQKLFNHAEIIAAGGIRNREDLQQLRQSGINKALCASALHNKTICSLDLQAVNSFVNYSATP